MCPVPALNRGSGADFPFPPVPFPAFRLLNDVVLGGGTMSAIGIVNLLQNLSNQNATPQNAPVAQSAAQPRPPQASQTPRQDAFTPSAQNASSQATAQAAGLFSVAGTSLFSTAANSLLAQNNAAPANQPAVAAPATAAVTATPGVVNAPAPQ